MFHYMKINQFISICGKLLVVGSGLVFIIHSYSDYSCICIFINSVRMSFQGRPLENWNCRITGVCLFSLNRCYQIILQSACTYIHAICLFPFLHICAKMVLSDLLTLLLLWVWLISLIINNNCTYFCMFEFLGSSFKNCMFITCKCPDIFLR